MTRVAQVRLAQVRFDLVELRLVEPMRFGPRMTSRRSVGLVRLTAEDGTEGVGEIVAEIAPDLAPDALPGAVEPVLAGLRGLDIADRQPLDGRLDTRLDARLVGLLPDGPIGLAIRAAVDTAVVDLTGRLSGRSVAQVLGGGRPSVALNALLAASGLDPDQLVAAARSLVQSGYRTIKIKGDVAGPSHRSAFGSALLAVRAAVGSDVDLRLDLNGDLTESEAIAWLPTLRDVGLEYVEQPIDPALGAAALARVRRAVPVPIAADEAVSDAAAAAELLASAGVDVLVIKQARVGGPRQARRIADAAATFGIDVTVSTFHETGIGVAAALHLAATLPGDRAHGLSTGALLEDDLISDGLPVADGRMALPTGAGLGVRLDTDAVERHRALPVAHEPPRA
jgi:o-succinylbenzoate synthase